MNLGSSDDALPMLKISGLVYLSVISNPPL